MHFVPLFAAEQGLSFVGDILEDTFAGQSCAVSRGGNRDDLQLSRLFLSLNLTKDFSTSHNESTATPPG